MPVAGDSYSDTEAGYLNSRRDYVGLASSLPTNNTSSVYNIIGKRNDKNNYTDEEDQGDPSRSLGYQEFGDNAYYRQGNRFSSRQRKKIAARSKGGEFQSKRRKRRVNFCCISSEINVEPLLDHLTAANDLIFGWKFHLYNDVLHLYKAGTPESLPIQIKPPLDILNNNTEDGHSMLLGDEKAIATLPENSLVAVDSKEVFVFDFGAAVFWGFSRGEEAGFLKTIRMFVTKGMVDANEFPSGEDDMAFVTSPDEGSITVANDVITLPDKTEVKQRLSVSFAIAQSSVLAIFESRIDRKVEEYKYIPETLAAYGKVNLSERQLGMMIGEVFVIRHDVNLHTEILGKCHKSPTHKLTYPLTYANTCFFFYRYS